MRKLQAQSMGMDKGNSCYINPAGEAENEACQGQRLEKPAYCHVTFIIPVDSNRYVPVEKYNTLVLHLAHD